MTEYVRCIYCYEDCPWELGSAEDEAGWHEECEAEMNDIFVRSMVLHDPKPLQRVMTRSLKGLPPLQKSRSGGVRISTQRGLGQLEHDP